VGQDVHGLDDLVDALRGGFGINGLGDVIEDAIEVIEDTGRELDSCHARVSGPELARGGFPGSSPGRSRFEIGLGMVPRHVLPVASISVQRPSDMRWNSSPRPSACAASEMAPTMATAAQSSTDPTLFMATPPLGS